MPAGAASMLMAGSTASLAGMKSSLPINGDTHGFNADVLSSLPSVSAWGADAMPPVMPGNIAATQAYGSTLGTAAYLGALPVTPAYQQAAAALGTQLGPESSMNPFEAGSSEPGQKGREMYRDASNNHDFKAMLSDLKAPLDGFSMPGLSHNAGMSAVNGSVESLGALDYGRTMQSTYMQSSGPGAMDGFSYGAASYGAAGEANPSAGYGASYNSVNSVSAAADIGRGSMKDLRTDSFNFPTAGSFVATPYDNDGLPVYDAQFTSAPSEGYEYQMGRNSSEVAGGKVSTRDEAEVYRSCVVKQAPGRASEGRPSEGAQARDSYMSGAHLDYAKASDRYADPTRGSANTYGGSASGMRNSAADYRGIDYRGASPEASAYPLSPPAGRASYASIGNSSLAGMGGPSGGSMLATSGSFVASPYAEGAPSFDMLPSPSSMPYSSPLPYSSPPSALPYSSPAFNSLQTSGSFVASPFAEGAPSPDMFGMSMASGKQGGYQDTFSNMPPASLGMYSAPPPNMSLGLGASSSLGFGSSPSPFVGFDVDVPGKSLQPGNFGLGPQAGSFVGMVPPSADKEGSRESTGVRFSDKKHDLPGRESQAATKSQTEKPSKEDSANPNSKQRMHRGSRDRDADAAPRTKRKGERRSCC